MEIHSYTEEENTFLKSLKGTDTYKNIALAFNKKFNCNVSKEATRRKMARGFYISHVSKYTQEQDDFIRENAKVYSLEKVKADFEKLYGFEITKQAIVDRCRRVYFSAPSKANKKLDFRQYWCEFEIGAEIEKDGYILIKIDNQVRNKRSNWKYKHHYIWEQHFGKMPKNHRIIFLDGDKHNFDIDNLSCVPLKYVCLFASNHWNFNNSELSKTAIKWCKLFYNLKEASI